ncbi:MAG: hypothetical protein SFV18_10640 [Bryobacteraceae bacterium]|nr:hypothetical protein [Bryobacteraceae bacterium]
MELELNALFSGRLHNRSPRFCVWERADLREIEEPLGVGLGVPRVRAKLRQPRSHDCDGKLILSDPMQRDYESRQLRFGNILKFVDKNRDSGFGAFGGLTHFAQEDGQIGFQVAVVGSIDLHYKEIFNI